MSREHVITAPSAERDLDDAFLYLAYEAGLPVAIRFDQAVEAAFQRIVELPGVGAPQEGRRPKTPGTGSVRMWRVPGFENYLIFYREQDDGIEVIRVLHGSRDIDSILLEEDLEPPATG